MFMFYLHTTCDTLQKCFILTIKKMAAENFNNAAMLLIYALQRYYLNILQIFKIYFHLLFWNLK